MVYGKEKKDIRVRIAPSPTGPLHIGTARVALFNYLFAKKYEGKFILRIEDTDRERSKKEWEIDIMDGLKWLGLDWDEGPLIESNGYKGNYGPYRQSERQEIYKGYLEKLIAEDKAYFCFCTPEELEAQKEYFISIGQPPHYSGKCRNLPEETVKKYLSEGKKFVIRLKTPPKKVSFDDVVRGKIEFDAGLIGDFVIAKDFNSPLYNFAVVVDDFEMKISHVIRGEDHIPNTPKQILIQEALGLPKLKYAHLPLILGPDRKKLSKRYHATSLSEYKKEGYLPEALTNFMAFLGWNPGTEKEIYSIRSLIKEFSLEKVQKGGAIFNKKRLDYINGFYIRQRSLSKVTELCIPYLVESGFIKKIKNGPLTEPVPKDLKLFQEKFKIKETGEIIGKEYLESIVKIYQARLKKISEIKELVSFFFKKNLDYPKSLLKWKDMDDKEILSSLQRTEKILSKIEKDNFRKEEIEKYLMPEAEKTGDRGRILWPFRASLTGKQASAGPFEIAEILGKEKVLERIKRAKNLLKQNKHE